MIAVVYSGSRHADWKLADKGKIVAEFKTQGINPFFNDEKQIIQMLNKKIELIHNAEKIKRIYFFGAGASSAERKQVLTGALSDFFKFSKVQVEHDILAASIASCDDKPGIIGILGSGSNAGYFDGKKVLENNYGLGYVLGDEGSANHLGKMLLRSYLTETLPNDLNKLFVAAYDLDRRQILDKVYKQAFPSLFLSSFVEFLATHREHEFIKALITDSFRSFLSTYIVPLHQQNPKAPIYFVGTIAATFQDILRTVASSLELEITTVIKEPIYNLLNYYANKN